MIIHIYHSEIDFH